MRSNSR